MPASLRALLLAEFSEQQEPPARPLTMDDLYEVPGLLDTADLLSLSAQVHAENGLGPDARATRALWLAATVAIACGATPSHERAKEALRRGDPDSARLLLEGAADSARQAGIGDALERAAESIGFDCEDLPNRG